jgi:hypothetical protein
MRRRSIVHPTSDDICLPLWPGAAYNDLQSIHDSPSLGFTFNILKMVLTEPHIELRSGQTQAAGGSRFIAARVTHDLLDGLPLEDD